MALPGLNTTILDGGLGVTSPATSVAHVVGVFESGAFNTPTLISNQRQLFETFGTHGPGNDCVGGILGFAGGPVVVTRTSEGTAATYDGGATAAIASSTGAGFDNEVNLAVATSAPKNDFDVVVTIVVGGALAATTFQYSLDGGKTSSPTLAAAASVALGTSGVTLEFEAGATAPYVAGATYTVSARAPHYSAANLATAKAAIDESQLDFDFFAFAGQAGDSAEAATLFATVAGQMTAYASADRPYRALMSGGDDSAANALAALGGLTDLRTATVFGSYRTSPPFGIIGRGLPYMPAVHRAAELAAANLISTDLAQVSGASTVGASPGAPKDGLSHDERTQNAGLDAAKIGTMRTYAELPGVYLTNVHLKSPPGSDFQYWQHGRIMDAAVRVVNLAHTLLISSSLIAKSDGSGSLTEASAQSVERRLQRALDAAIGSAARGKGPPAIDGTTGHVSEIRYQVDRTNNFLATNEIICTVSIVPRGYLKTLSTTFSYSLTA